MMDKLIIIIGIPIALFFLAFLSYGIGTAVRKTDENEKESTISVIKSIVVGFFILWVITTIYRQTGCSSSDNYEYTTPLRGR